MPERNTIALVQDAAFLNNPARWPGKVCCVKKYLDPNDYFKAKYGWVGKDEDGVPISTVVVKDGEPEVFDSMSEMVKAGWLVD